MYRNLTDTPHTQRPLPHRPLSLHTTFLMCPSLTCSATNPFFPGTELLNVSLQNRHVVESAFPLSCRENRMTQLLLSLFLSSVTFLLVPVLVFCTAARKRKQLTSLTLCPCVGTFQQKPTITVETKTGVIAERLDT